MRGLYDVGSDNAIVSICEIPSNVSQTRKNERRKPRYDQSRVEGQSRREAQPNSKVFLTIPFNERSGRSLSRTRSPSCMTPPLADRSMLRLRGTLRWQLE